MSFSDTTGDDCSIKLHEPCLSGYACPDKLGFDSIFRAVYGLCGQPGTIGASRAQLRKADLATPDKFRKAKTDRIEVPVYIAI